MKKSKSRPAVRPNQPARLTPEAAEAIAAYQQWMLENQDIMVSINRAISVLIRRGWQAIQAEAAAQKAAQS